jgi:hypothetical protein
MAGKDTPRVDHDYESLKVFAWAEGRWRSCPYRKCLRVGRCLGGPRGTMRALGKPLCRKNDKHKGT